jgi:hypothetical protein
MTQKGTYSITQIKKSAEAHFDDVGRGKGTGYKQFQRWLYAANKERQVDGVLVKQNDQMRSLRSYKAKARASNDLQSLATSASGSWLELGPTYWDATQGWNPGVGRVTSIGVDETNLNHIIVGGPNSGVWKTTNNGTNWVNLTDDFQNVNVWSLEIDPNNSNTYYWGSAYGDMFKSIDGGNTWNELTFPGGANIIRILVHPTNSSIVFAVSSGLYKSINGGVSWSQVSGASTGGYDVEFKPGDPNTVYFSSAGVYKSTDGGDNFSSVSGVGTGAKMMAVTADNPSVLYVVEASGGSFGGFYKSTNSGDSFTQQHNSSVNFFGYSTTGSDNSGQAPRDMDVTCNPSDENEVHIAGILTWKSINGGTSFTATSDWTPTNVANKGLAYCHADVDILKYHGNVLFVGSDGGIYTSTDAAVTYVDRTTGIGSREFYRIGVSKTDPNVISGGSQDNGTSVMRGANREWKDWLGADGMESFVDWSDPTILYGTSQSGSMYKSTNQGNSRTGITKPSGSGAWVTPFEQDPTVSNTIYVGFNEVWKSTEQGANWQQISNFGGGSLDELKIAPSNNQYIYAADGSTLNGTKNGGTTWSSISPGGTINYIHVSPNEPERIVAVTSSNIYISTDAGASWVNYTKNLPNTSYYCAFWQDNSENGLYIGGNGFISYIEDGMTDYITFDDGLANCRVYELEINYVSNKIFAGTYGRGLWESDIYGSQVLDYDAVAENIINVPSELCGSSVSPQFTLRNKGGLSLTAVKIEVFLNNNLIETINHTTNLATNVTETITLSQVVYTTEGSNSVKVVVSEPNGQADQKNTNDEAFTSTTVAFGTAHTLYITERSANTSFTWEIKDVSTVVKSGSYGTALIVSAELQEEVCLQAGCYDFVMTDGFNSGQCTAAAWSSGIQYCVGDQVSRNGILYEAKWCGVEDPATATQWGQWNNLGSCAVSYDSDVFGFKENGEVSYFETEVQNYTSLSTNEFCYGSNMTVDFYADITTTGNCENIVFNANVTGGSPSVYAWDFGSGASPATANSAGPHTVKYLTAGNKSASLTVDGVNESKTDYVVINTDANKAVTASIALSNSPTCDGDLVQISANLTNEGNSPNYSWKVGVVEVSKAAAFSSTSLSNGDVVELTVSSDDECSLPSEITSSGFTVSLTANKDPTIAISISNGATWPICFGEEMVFESTIDNGGNSPVVTWYVDGIADGTGASYDYSGANGEKVTAKVNSSSTCLSSNDVASNEVVTIVDLCTLMDETDIVSLHFYPNPVENELVVEGANIEEVILIDVTGKLILSNKGANSTVKLDMSELSSGNYMLKVIYNSGKEEVKEIQKK